MSRAWLVAACLLASCAPAATPRLDPPARLDPPPRLLIRPTLQGDAQICVEEFPRRLADDPCIDVDALRRLLRGLEPTRLLRGLEPTRLLRGLEPTVLR